MADLNVNIRLNSDQVQADAQKAAETAKKTLNAASYGGSGVAGIKPDAVSREKEINDQIKQRTVELKFQQKIQEGIAKLEKEREKAMQAAKSSSNKVLEDWRKSFAGKAPNVVDMSGRAAAASSPWKPTEPMTIGTAGLATSSDSKAILRDKEKEIAREADLSRIKDAREAGELAHEKDKLNFNKNMSMLMMPLVKPFSVWGTAFAARSISSGLLGTETGRTAMSKFGLSGSSGASIATAGLIAAATAIGISFKTLKIVIEGVIASFEQARNNYAKALTSGMGLGISTSRGAMSSIIGVDEKEIMKFGKAMAYLKPKIKEATDTIARTTPNLTSVSWGFDIIKLNLQALFATIANDAAPAIRALTTAINGLVIASKYAWEYIGRQIVAAITKTIIGPINDILLKLGLKLSGGTAAPTPEARMNQLRSSSWEKMGLIVGSGGGTNYNEKTAKNTGTANTILKQIHAALRGQEEGGTAGYGTVPAIP